MSILYIQAAVKCDSCEKTFDIILDRQIENIPTLEALVEHEIEQSDKLAGVGKHYCFDCELKEAYGE